MNRAQFHNQALGEPYEPTRRERLLASLAQRYDDTCEVYDRTVCTGEIRDGRIMPTPGTKESSLINKNAREVKDQIFLEHPGVTVQELHEAIRRHHARP